MEEVLNHDLREVVREEMLNVLDLFQQPDPLLTPEQVASQLKIKPQTLALWRCKGGTGPSWKKIGSSVRYSQKELKQWIEQQSVNN